jgi:hypothetical protein
MATILQDTFTRGDQSNWGTATSGGSWNTATAGSGGSLSISSNRGANTAGGSGEAGGYIALSQQNDITITFTIATSSVFATSSDLFDCGVRNTTTVRLTNAYGIRCGQGSLQIIDCNTQKATTSFTTNASTTYNVEIAINSDNHIDAYVYTGSKPGTPTLSFTNSGSPYTPTASGSNLILGTINNDPSNTNYFDDLLVVSPNTGPVGIKSWNGLTVREG